MESLILWTFVVSFVNSVVAHVEQDLNTRQALSSSIFHHRAYHNSIVLGDYLYIDGGEIATWNGRGTGDPLDPSAVERGNYINVPNNSTYSIALTTSWTNSTVILNEIHKTAPTLVAGALWLDHSGETFYAYDGGVSWAPLTPLSVPPNALWEFTPSGKLGTWSLVNFSPQSNFTALDRVDNGIYGYGNGLGFALGGTETTATESLIYSSMYAPPGMVIFNSTSQEWFNISMDAISNSGTASDGVGQFVPSFGPAGLFFVLGGISTSESQAYFALDNIAMYEPLSQQWLFQEASGDVPSPGEFACAVGVEGDNGTYEIFLYGGFATGSIPDTVAMGVVYVLSLPSFHWQKQNYNPTYGRCRHSCNLVGNRQMVVVGGIVVDPNFLPNATDPSAVDAPDPWPQGLGIFDLSAMQWSDSYDSSASAYVTPQLMKAYIEEHGPYPSTWSDSTVKEVFTGKKTTNTKTHSPSPEPSKHNKSGSTNVGAIAGGVVGGVVGLLIVVGVIFMVLHRRRRDHRNSSPEELKDPKTELDGRLAPQEVTGAGKPAEMDTRTRAELEGGWQGHEVRGATGPGNTARSPT